MFRPRHARRQVGEDQIVPAIMRDEAIGSGKVDAQRPFLGADRVAGGGRNGFRAQGGGHRVILSIFYRHLECHGSPEGDRGFVVGMAKAPPPTWTT